ncbi:uncharacterized protein BP01DRAFT_382494 [Aspergillus saccharolyticus JOP 1030-1]|uniref:Mid2 domain-containing protein n=1 Tax=Aspergillus saccharolyticus JOP 1030-1 TaxID=1450539 RepID=A0A318ZD96_9EURO|nr:hypothetical protein BP01DRAFT_382494 [Aspergillus saccharolyticus JOP 1030-1]PYH45471.1 hypothetical protein BP01DRAFT_382494 [Aspergillus saccharolyticus JOP 1030-1]
MAHHGNGHTRFNRSMRKRYQSEEGGLGGADQVPAASDSPIRILQEAVVSGVDRELVTDQGVQSQHSQGSGPVIHLKRMESNTSTDDKTTVVATVVNVVESGSQTTGLSTTETASATSDESTQATTSGLSAKSGSVTAPTSALVNQQTTASPAYSSPTADTPTVTTATDPSASVSPSSLNSSKTSTPLFGNTAAHPPASSTPIRPTSTGTDSSTNSTQSTSTTSTTVNTSTSGVSYVDGYQSGTTTSYVSSETATTSYVSSETATTSYVSFETATTSSSWSDTSSYAGAWGTATNGVGGGADATATGQSPSATAAAASGGLSTQTKGQIAGGVVGGVAGAMVFVVLLWLLLRRRKRAILPQTRDALPAADMTGTATTEGSITRSAEMTSRRSSNDPLFTASYFAPAFMQRWRQSHMTTRTTESVCSDSSERGFQKISGRKIPSVLHSGGDGYGGGVEQTSPTASEPSSTYAAPGSPVIPRSPPSQPPLTTPYGMPLDTSYTREADEPAPVVKFRPSPARTPVTGSANASLHNEPSAPRMIPSVHVQVSGSLSPTMPKRPDALGRSHPSFDGSRGSRFTESI